MLGDQLGYLHIVAFSLNMDDLVVCKAYDQAALSKYTALRDRPFVIDIMYNGMSMVPRA